MATRVTALTLKSLHFRSLARGIAVPLLAVLMAVPASASRLNAPPEIPKITWASLPTAPLEQRSVTRSGAVANGLIGLDSRQTLFRLGAPLDIEDRAPALVWRYERGGCALSVFFFMDMTTRTFRALSFDLKTNQDTRDDDKQCHATLLERAADGSGRTGGRAGE